MFTYGYRDSEPVFFSVIRDKVASRSQREMLLTYILYYDNDFMSWEIIYSECDAHLIVPTVMALSTCLICGTIVCRIVYLLIQTHAKLMISTNN